MKRAVKALLAVAAVAGLSTTGQAIAADAGNGEALYRSICAQCHSIDPGSHRTGPSLHKIWGAPIGAREGFEYSDAFRQAASDGLVWTPENLNTFVERPRRLIKGNKMAYLGLRDDADRADLLEYLKQMSQ